MSASAAGQVLFVPINISTATTTHLIAAVSGKTIVVDKAVFCFSGTTPTAKFQDTTGTPVVLTGVFDTAGVYALLGERLNPLFATSKGQGLDIVTTGTPSMRGFLAYHLEDAQ